MKSQEKGNQISLMLKCLVGQRARNTSVKKYIGFLLYAVTSSKMHYPIHEQDIYTYFCLVLLYTTNDLKISCFSLDHLSLNEWMTSGSYHA